MEITVKGQTELCREVRDAQLCTACGACVDLCPYHAIHQDQVVTLHACDIKSGRCYAFCPRTPADTESMRTRFFDPGDLTPEVGAVKDYLIARAASEAARRAAQHGGTVTALMSLALKEGLIQSAVVSENADAFVQRGVAVTKSQEIRKRGGSRFISAGAVAAFNRAAQSTVERIGVVATPCQAFALAKMRMKPIPEKDNHIDKLKLVIGLFCGWTLSWRTFTALLESRVGLKNVTGMDIFPGKKQVDILTAKGSVGIPWEEIDPLVRDACRYCMDTTAEYADLSVGSARIPLPWEELRTWNQVIVRTQRGRDLIELARKKKVLEFREAPAAALEELKRAALAKKEASLAKPAEKTGNRA